jgi:hypothetical protein
MFLAIVFIVLGVFLLLNAMGIIVGGSFWGLFWAIVFLAIGFRLLAKRGKCPICGFGVWQGRIHEKMHQHCDCEQDKDRENHN